MTRETKQQIIDRLAREISELNACHRQRLNAERDKTAIWVEKFYAIRWLLRKERKILWEKDYEAIMDYVAALEEVASKRWYTQYMDLAEFKHCARAYAADTKLNPAKLLMDALEGKKAAHEGDVAGANKHLWRKKSNADTTDPR